mgnify:CR=1 FL=1
MELELIKKNKVFITLFSALLVFVHLLFEHFHGGIVTHFILQDDSLPGISNWWGLLTFPLATWVVLLRIEKRNNAKAALIYNEIDRNPLFKGFAAKEDRSTMNATFNLVDEEAHKATFDALAKEAGLSGINGHRSVGGYRASMYNALPIESVQALVDVMQALEKQA